jgi:hypothetical protein
MATKKATTSKASSGSSAMVALNYFLTSVTMRGEELSAKQVCDVAHAASSVGQVYHLDTCLAVVDHEGEAHGIPVHHFRIHVRKDRLMEALDTLAAYQRIVLPDAHIVIEISPVTVFAIGGISAGKSEERAIAS